MMEPASRLLDSKTDIWSTVNSAVAQSKFSPVVNLGQGFFGYNPPHFIQRAAKDAIDNVGCNQYSHTKGRPRLRKALANSFKSLFDRPLDSDNEVLVTTGANEGILSIIMAYLNPGDEVIMFEPHFDQFVKNVTLAGGTVKYVSLKLPDNIAADPFSIKTKVSTNSQCLFDIEELERAVSPRTKILILNTPHNPTGKVFSTEELQQIGSFCQRHSLLLLSDEVYSRLYFPLKDKTEDTLPPFPHPATLFPSLTLTVGSAGKDFAATGWRVGFVLGQAELLKPVSVAHTSICFASPSASQEAVAVGYEMADEMGYWTTTCKEISRKMTAFNAVWDELGLPYIVPEGGYLVLVSLARLTLPSNYRFPDFVELGDDDTKMTWFLINEIGVAALPSAGFYIEGHPDREKNLFRFAVCRENNVLELAKERLSKGLPKYIK